MIPFNKPCFTGKEINYIRDAIQSGKISGNGDFTKKCQELIEKKYFFNKCLLTTSCTDALEMCAILLDIQPGDEIIIPSYTFVSTANAFVLRGAKIVFADSNSLNPNLDETLLESLVTKKTKAIVVVHYGGIACRMDVISAIAKKYGLYIIEDAAQSIDSFYNEQPLGSLGELAAFSFHETKNIISGEGGMLVVNDGRFEKRSEIIWEKGTNRSAFWRGEVDKYGWVDLGSSFLPSEITAAFLFAQLENLDKIQTQRKKIWQTYKNGLTILEDKGYARLPFLPSFATNNAHLFYLVCQNEKERDNLIKYLKDNGIYSVFHYLSLHKSPFYKDLHDKRELPHSDHYTDCLLRLPLFYDLTDTEVEYVIEKTTGFFN